jgi:hypothetical protein
MALLSTYHCCDAYDLELSSYAISLVYGTLCIISYATYVVRLVDLSYGRLDDPSGRSSWGTGVVIYTGVVLWYTEPMDMTILHRRVGRQQVVIVMSVLCNPPCSGTVQESKLPYALAGRPVLVWSPQVPWCLELSPNHVFV